MMQSSYFSLRTERSVEKNRTRSAHTWLIQRCSGNSVAKKIVCPVNCAGSGTYLCRKLTKLDFSLYIKINLKWIMGLNLEADNVKLFGRKLWRKSL